MSRVLTPQAEKKLADTVKSVTRRGKRYIVRKNGRVVGAIISARDLERLTRVLEDESDLRDTLARLADPKESPILYEEARARLGLHCFLTSPGTRPCDAHLRHEYSSRRIVDDVNSAIISAVNTV